MRKTLFDFAVKSGCRFRAQCAKPRRKPKLAKEDKVTDFDPTLHSVQERLEPRLQSRDICDLTFPHHKIFPPKCRQSPFVKSISLLVPFQLRQPIRSARLGDVSARATAMKMPKTSIDEDNFAERTKDEIGFAGQVRSVETVMAAKTPTEFPHDHLRLRVGRANPGHVFAAFIRCQVIHC